jgi:hypothetical protein
MKDSLQGDPHFGEEDLNPYFSTFFIPTNRVVNSGATQETCDKYNLQKNCECFANRKLVF